MWTGQGWGDARIEANEYIKEKWLKEIPNIINVFSSTFEIHTSTCDFSHFKQ
jgi:hypothetical protein